MKKISQAIIGATLILDVAVVFTFGLAVISSFEDGSRLPEMASVRKASEGRVAGVTTSVCPTTANVFIEAPIASSVITTETFRISAMAGTSVPPSVLMNFVYPVTAPPFYNRIPAVYQPYTASNGAKWVADVKVATEQIPNGSFAFHAEGYDAVNNCIAKSDGRNISINFTSSNMLPAPAVNITSPLPDGTLSGTQAAVTGEISNFPSGAQVQDAKIIILSNLVQAAGPFSAPAMDATSSLKRQSIFDSTTIANGAYDVKIFVHYIGTDSLSKFIESAPMAVNINNTGTTSTSTSNNQNANSNIDTSSGANYNSNVSNANTSAANANTSTSTSGINTNSAASTNTSTGTTTPPPPAGTAVATLTAAIINPAPSTTPVILRHRDNLLAAKTSAAASGLKFIIHKSGEPADWITPIDAVSPDKINWKANMNLTVFKDGVYDITAVSEGINSASVNVLVQKFGFNWINPQPLQKLSSDVPIEARIDGIYEKDGITPVKGIKVYFYQTNTQSPYTEIYNEQLYQNPGIPEWRLYDWSKNSEKLWNTSNSSNGKYRLIVKIINESISASNIWFPAEPIFVEINNQQAVLPSNNNINASALIVNNNQNKNANINAAAVNSAAGDVSNNYAAQANINAANANSAVDMAAAAAQSDSDKDLLSNEKEQELGTDPNSADTDNDGLTDFVEVDKWKTNPLKNDTDGDGYLDGEEVQSLHDPLRPPTDPTAAVLVKPKPVEEPKASAKPILKSLAVEKIENKPLRLPNNTNNPEPPPVENTIVLKGKGPANTILTLFIYSVDPLVITVKTDDDGNWQYELDKKLDDGKHDLYVTVTDDTGKIQSQSNPIAFFVKEAKAVSPESYRADLAAREPVKTSSTDIYLIASGVLVLIAAVAGLAVALRRKSGI